MAMILSVPASCDQLPVPQTFPDLSGLKHAEAPWIRADLDYEYLEHPVWMWLEIPD